MTRFITGAILMTAITLAAFTATAVADQPFGDEGPTLTPNALGLVYKTPSPRTSPVR